MNENTTPPGSTGQTGESGQTGGAAAPASTPSLGTGFSGCVTILAVIGLLTVVIGGIIGSIAFTRLGAESEPRFDDPWFEEDEPYRDLRFEDADCERRGPGLFGDDDRRFGDSAETDAEAQFADDRSSTESVWEEWCDEDFSHQLDFGAIGSPTFREEVWDRGGDRFREIEIFLDEGRDDIEIAMWNPEPLPIGGNGIAVRTTDDARLLSTSEFVTIERPDDCRDGCRVIIWLSLGWGFLDDYPDAEVVIYAGTHADATMESLSRAPREMYQ